GVFRFLAEFAREPDTVYGYLPLGLSMGQWLSLPMVIAGIWLFVWAGKRKSN
ncbi:MAG: prolipoprotein diacylglyceryl transferase, partial [Betaproteobacteria bacterium]|nr:prolipoprotein diacylglyceryl transferase [Betaproteobacteria bacterium]